MNTPLVSVVLPFHNNQATLALAVRSIVNQTFTDWELVLVNDGATDDSVDVLRQFADARIRLLTNPSNLGLAASLNHGIGAAKGQYIARMDADDLSHPERLERQLRYLQAHPEVDVLGAAMLAFTGAGEPRALMRAPLTDHAIKRGACRGSIHLYHPTWMAKAAWFRAHPYDLRFRKAQDYELLLRAARDSHFANLPDVLMGYREDAANLPKRVRSRAYVLRAQVKNLLCTGRLLAFALAVAVTLAKMAADVFVLRGRPARDAAANLEDLSDADRAQWAAVFNQAAGDPSCAA